MLLMWKLLSLLLVGGTANSEAGLPKDAVFRRNNHDNPDSSVYPNSFSRFRRNFPGSRDDSSPKAFDTFASLRGSPSSFSAPSRKGGSRNPPSRGGGLQFPGFGGPDAFLMPETTESAQEDDSSVLFRGNGGYPGFPQRSRGFSNSAANRGNRLRNSGSNNSGRPNESEQPSFSFPGSSGNARFGNSASFGSSSPNRGSYKTGTSAFNAPPFPNRESSNDPFPSPSGFGSNSPFGSSPSFSGSLDGSLSNRFSPPAGSSSKNSFPAFPSPIGNNNFPSFNSPGGNDPFPVFGPGGETDPFPSGANVNSFPSPIGGASAGISFPGAGSSVSFPGASYSGSGFPGANSGPISSGNAIPTIDANLLNALKGNPDFSDIALSLDELMGITPTTTKPPLRVASDEDRDKIFSGGPDADVPGRKGGSPSRLQSNPKSPGTRAIGCGDEPDAPVNGLVQCSTYAGCRAQCNRGYKFPGGDTRLYIACEDGQWEIRGGPWTVTPPCEPDCNPPCQNEGICLEPNVCQCPDNFEGPLCDKPKSTAPRECSNKPPTPMNSRIFCSREECIAKCHEKYEFAPGVTRLFFDCVSGDWRIRDERWTSVPDCIATCDPDCENGGRCLAPDICECTPEFRGDHCQYPISNCDAKKLNFNGGYNCTGEGMDFGCKLWCPAGINFKFPAESIYTCDYATGRWSPQPIPECDYDSVFGNFESGSISFGNEETGLDTKITSILESQVSHIVDHGQAVKREKGICFTWSGMHYKSFDGRVYSFDSNCPYTILQDAALGTFTLNLIPDTSCGKRQCPKKLRLFLEGDEYTLTTSGTGRPALIYRDTSLAIPGQMNGLVTERVAHFVVLKLSGIGLTIKWDMKNLVITEVSELLWNRTAGLCGLLDGVEGNDWAYADGSSETQLTTFLKAWEANTLGESCSVPPNLRSPCSGKPIGRQATQFCSKLMTDPRFEQCRNLVDVSLFVTTCKWDFCSCDEEPTSCACDSFSSFFRACSAKGGSVDGGWRSQSLCPMDCDYGREYKSCMPAIEPRCGQAADISEPEFCVEGCDCRTGTVLMDGKCVTPDDCPCTYHNKTYSRGDTIPNDCNSCTCMGGEWQCTEVKCGSRCASVGDPHYTTFDGKKFDFMGKCSYYLVKGPDYSIEAENTPCAGAISEAMNFPASVVSQFPSCTKSVSINIGSSVIKLQQNREVFVNGVQASSLPLWVNNVFIKKASNIFVVAELPNGLDVWWDGQTRAYVDAPSEMRGLVSGLCGTFTDNQRDDFLTPEGDVEQNHVAFANKWKTSDKCDDMPLTEEAHPCDRHIQNKDAAEKYCAQIKSYLFSDCHLNVDPESYYDDCLYDLCSCEAELSNCMCPIFAAYSKECARKGVLVDWRTKIRECGLHCKGGQKYQVCGNSCTHSCYDLATNPGCKRKCVEGCNCPEGFSLDASGTCVSISQCPCVYLGKEYKAGYEMMQPNSEGTNSVCECVMAQWECREPSQNELLSQKFFEMPQVGCLEQNNEVYTDCMPDEEYTCKTMHFRTQEQVSDTCKPGCHCAEGYVRDSDSGKCLEMRSCPCHHGGRSYSEGEKIIEECNSCSCVGGEWSCTTNECPGMCTAWGDSHFKTFDGKMYEFHGTCDYMLAKAKSKGPDSFEVSIQNVPCGTNGVTCAKSITLRVGARGSQEIIEFSKDKPIPKNEFSRTVIREAGVFVFAEVPDMGLVLQWDKGTRAYLTLANTWKNKVKGLCGNYNADEQDDFQTPSGGTAEASARIFGDSWRLQNHCPESTVIEDTCAMHPQRKVWAAEKCAVLKSAVFASCHSEVPVDPYVTRCQFDSCGCDTGGDCECLCTALAAYAHECNIHGVYIAWRTPDLCPMQCDENCEHYEPCIPTCPTQTCDTLLEPQSPNCQDATCVEGCAKDVCPPGHVYKSATDKECVPEPDCSNKCLEIDGEVYMEGDKISEDDCHTCFCSRKKKVCRGSPCTTTVSPYATSPKQRVTTPLSPITTSPAPTASCKSGWSVWINNDHPLAFKKSTDEEPLPDRITRTNPDKGYCGKDMYADIRCRVVGTHESFDATNQPVVCNLDEGLLCRGRRGKGVRPQDACKDYEISVLCDCGKQVPITTPLDKPVTPPPIEEPEGDDKDPDPPVTCTDEWTPWFSYSTPDVTGEFENVSKIREYESFCPGNLIDGYECRYVHNRANVDSHVTCDYDGAACRNNVGSPDYCRDVEVRFNCLCECVDGLGMENFSIPDSAISSSNKRGPDTAPSGRLNQFIATLPSGEYNPIMAWMMDDNVAPSEQWLQIEFEDQTELTGIVTQGSPLEEQDLYVTKFAVRLSKDGSGWNEVTDPGKDHAKIFLGNTDKNTPVTNLFPESFHARYIQIVPMATAKDGGALRIELKGCGQDTNDIGPDFGIEKTTTEETTSSCDDGWTIWMNSNVPQPGKWDDIENYSSLRKKYDFCDESMIIDTQCQVVGTGNSHQRSGQQGIVCSHNLGLQCIDDLQTPEHCLDYEIRFYCDCSKTTLMTTSSPALTSPFSTTTESSRRPGPPGPFDRPGPPGPFDRPGPPGPPPPPPGYAGPPGSHGFSGTRPPKTTPEDVEQIEQCDVSKPAKSHESSCKLFYECQVMTSTSGYFVEKSCGPGTMFNPVTMTCTWPADVIRIRPECEYLDKFTTPKPTATTRTPYPQYVGSTTPKEECVETWTEWFNVSHPSLDGGDFESYERIKAAYPNICSVDMIKDVQCQFNKLSVTQIEDFGPPTRGRKGGRKSARRPAVTERYTSNLEDFRLSDDVNVMCDDNGLACDNNDQSSYKGQCEDYAIRFLCSCEEKKDVTTPALPPYTDVRRSSATPDEQMYNDWCPPGKSLLERAIPCARICMYYGRILAQSGQCLNPNDYAPACADDDTGVVCPPGMFLRDKSTCVAIFDCNCYLPSGIPAPPGKTFLVSDCEVCMCQDNQLQCDSSACVTTVPSIIPAQDLKKFGCNEWGPWLNINSPTRSGETEGLLELRQAYPDLCAEPVSVECVTVDGELTPQQTGQNVVCSTTGGLQCRNARNPGGCLDFKVRFYCLCEEETTTSTTRTTTRKPALKPATTTPLPRLPGCYQPFWSEWFNSSHPAEGDGDYEMIDDIAAEGGDICPKAYIQDIECVYNKEIISRSNAGISKGRKGARKGRPQKLVSVRYEETDYMDSDDVYVQCTKDVGLTCSNLQQPARGQCHDYAIRVLCSCDPVEQPPAGVPTTTPVMLTTESTPYPGWPALGPDCQGNKLPMDCAASCDRVCMYYKGFLNNADICLEDTDCAPACGDPIEGAACPSGLYLQDNSTCVGADQCTCKLPDGTPLPAGKEAEVSECEVCSCAFNKLSCSVKSSCKLEETTMEPLIGTSTLSPLAAPKKTTPSVPKATTTPVRTPPSVNIKCNDWTPWLNMRRNSEGDFQVISELRTRTEFADLCEAPVNISCREANAKLPASQLGQVLTCDPTIGLVCRNEDNSEDCYDYEVSFYCECDERQMPDEVFTTAPITLGVTTTPAPCNAWSPWINEHKPWLGDGDAERKTLEQLREEIGFCMDGELAEIECDNTANGLSVPDKDTVCNLKFGFICENEKQSKGACYDHRIRYFCSCQTTPSTSTIVIVPITPTPPYVCMPEDYINLLPDVPDEMISASSVANNYFGPLQVRLDDPAARGFRPQSRPEEYIQIAFVTPQTVYGLIVSGSPSGLETVRTLAVQVSDDGIVWSDITDDPTSPYPTRKVFTGPISGKAPPSTLLFPQPVETKFLRILSLSWYLRPVMMIEVIGCNYLYTTSPPTLKEICDEPMGLEDGYLEDDQIQVSSVQGDQEYYGKSNARLHYRGKPYEAAGGWVPKIGENPFIRFDFLEPRKISGVVTQGRSDASEWVTSYKVRYSPDGENYNTLKDPLTGEDKIFSANFDRDTPVKNTFDKVIETRFLEIVPISWESVVAMRVEIKGCYHPYNRDLLETTTATTPSTPTPAPPPYCRACDNLPPSLYSKCPFCSGNLFFDGNTCVPKALCPCYKHGVSYPVGAVFETVDCKECTCELNGEESCEKKECPPCDDAEKQRVLTPNCDCMCKPCSEGTRLCPSSNYCIKESQWCDGVQNCDDDETDCPVTTTPVPVVPGCPTPSCPGDWQVTITRKGNSTRCPVYDCNPPQVTTPVDCPPPSCPLGLDIVLKQIKRGLCPMYDCVMPSTTMMAYTCPPPTCPFGYQTVEEIDYYYDQQQTDDGCPQYNCVTESPTGPCTMVKCPDGYEVNFADSREVTKPCPQFQCLPIVTTTACPPTECAPGLRTMYLGSTEGGCPQYTCIKVTTPSDVTVPMPTVSVCPEIGFPVCEPGEELYKKNPNELCPEFGCKKIGAPPPTSPAPSKTPVTPECEMDGRSFNTFDGTDFKLDTCNHVLARDKSKDDWLISVHKNCTEEGSCSRFLKVRQEDNVMVLSPELTIEWDTSTYSVSQMQKIGAQTNTFTVSRQGDSLYVQSLKHDFYVAWDVNMNVKIGVDDSLLYQVDGLCGFYTGTQSDDKSKPDGSLASNTDEYGDSWALEGTDCEETKCSPETAAAAFQLCNTIDSKPFTACHDKVAPSSFLPGCVEKVCGCLTEGGTEEECKCSALSRYIKKCLEVDSTVDVLEWRVSAECYKDCPENERFLDCHTTCEKTCDTLQSSCPDLLQSSPKCSAGCFCDPGLVRKDGRCVRPDNCGDCTCEGYGDPHYKSFDRHNFTFNGECSYVAARHKDRRGNHKFQVIAHNKRCNRDPITMCTDQLRLLYGDQEATIKLLPSNSLLVTVDGSTLSDFPFRNKWLAAEQPDEKRVALAVPKINLELTYTAENYGFTITIPSHLFFNETEGLCGNCNSDHSDDQALMTGNQASSVEEFGLSWQLNEDNIGPCQIFRKEDEPCIPLPPDQDPCLTIMDPAIFGECHPLEDPVAYVDSCQLDTCLSSDPREAACQSLTAYSKRCAQLDVCLNWRTDDLCPVSCENGMEFKECGPGCVHTCDNFEEYEKNPESCPFAASDGCFCPDNMVLENGICVNKTQCKPCDEEGHREGDVWQQDICTTCECKGGSVRCTAKSCSQDPICDRGYDIVEVPFSGDECCGPRKKCEPMKPSKCPPADIPREPCGFGKTYQLIRTDVCPFYACVCVAAQDCPSLEQPDEDALLPGESWEVDDLGCCIRWTKKCTGDCPALDCQEFYELETKPLADGACCPEQSCVPPTDSCIYEPKSRPASTTPNRVKGRPVKGVKGRPAKLESAPVKMKYSIGEAWADGPCIECECAVDSEGLPYHNCVRQTCPSVKDHPDRKDYELRSVNVTGQCCPDIVRSACIEDYDVIQVGEELPDSLNGCLSVSCEINEEGRVEKLEKMLSCDEDCPKGWVYQQSPLHPQVCCGSCIQTQCMHDGIPRRPDERWTSPDFCIKYQCVKEYGKDTLETRAVEEKCKEPSEDEQELYIIERKEAVGQCCPSYTKTACILDGKPFPVGKSLPDPRDSCVTVECIIGSDGNVTRRVREKACTMDCPPGSTYYDPPAGSDECCGRCIPTHCVDDGIKHEVGASWTDADDICFEFTCFMRDDVPTILGVKSDCPYFNPECPESEIYSDPSGCCKLCNVSLSSKHDCQPEPMDPKATIGLFVMEWGQVGVCRNIEPVALNMCRGHCDSSSVFKQAGSAPQPEPECFCCQPSDYEQISIPLTCSVASFNIRRYNIKSCSCIPCGQGLPQQDQPINDETEFYSFTQDSVKN